MQKNEYGFVLIAVLWMLLLMSIIALSYLRATHHEVRHAFMQYDRVQADLLAKGALEWAVYEMLNSRPNDNPTVSDQKKLSLNGAKISITLRNEQEKLDLNRAEEGVIRDFLFEKGIGEPQAQEISAAILDWRDHDDHQRLNGAEKRSYQKRGIYSSPRNNLFKTVDELKRVEGVTDEIFHCIRDDITIFSGLGSPLKKRLSQQPLVGRAYELEVNVSLNSNIHITRRAVIRLTGDPYNPYWLHEWNNHRSQSDCSGV